ncbi:MAG: phosphoglycerate kinase [Candidatus Thermoplasmatota archaeon]
MKGYNTLDDFDLEDKTVLLRVDFNMPLDKDSLEILDTNRIEKALPTIKELVEKNAKTVIMAHQGRPGSWDFTSLEHHAEALHELLNHPVGFVEDISGEEAQKAIKKMQGGNVLFIDNVRKFDGERESKTAEEHSKTEFVQNLYPLADLFVNDAFAAAHRAQCSLIGFTAVLPSCAGRLMEKELSTLSKIVKKPEKPSVFMFGGAKFSDVIVTIERLLENETADKILLTGLPANAFLKAKGVELGEANEKALMDEGSSEKFQEIKNLLQRYEDKIFLPLDFGVEKEGGRVNVSMDDLPVEQQLFDIGEKTIDRYKQALSNAKTVFLSGPCGVFENKLFMKGTKEIFELVAKSDAFSIVGGGHTVAAVRDLNLEDKFSHISTGGGSLERFMMGEKLPVVEALKKAKNRHIVKN